MDGVDGKETGTDQTRSQSSFESIAANLSEDNYNGAVECDVNEMISYRIEPTDQIIPPLKRKFFPYTLKNSLSFKFHFKYLKLLIINYNYHLLEY